MAEKRQWFSGLAAFAAAMLVAGCGGGSNSPEAVTSVTGTAATGAPVIGGTVTMICAGGTAGTAVTTSSTGTFTVTATGVGPCIIKVASASIPGSGVLLSIVEAGQARANVNQLTHMLAALLANGDPDTLLFKAPGSIAGLVTSAKVVTQKANVQQVVAAMFTAVGGGLTTTFDFLTGNFTADGTGFDKLLDNVSFTSGTGFTSVAITLKGTGTILIQFALSGTAPTLSGTTGGVQSAANIADLTGLQAFVVALQSKVFGNTATFASVAAAQTALSDVIGTALGSPASGNNVFVTSAGSVKVNPSLAALKSLTAQAPTLSSVVSNNVLNLLVKFNFTNSASTVSSNDAQVLRASSTASGASAWTLTNITP